MQTFEMRVFEVLAILKKGDANVKKMLIWGPKIKGVK